MSTSRNLLRWLAAAACTLATWTPTAQAAPRGFEKISAGVWAFVAQDERSANGALFIGSNEALVVDPGLTPALAQRFFAGARATTDRPTRTEGPPLGPPTN